MGMGVLWWWDGDGDVMLGRVLVWIDIWLLDRRYGGDWHTRKHG